jgi:hypothetical protein
VKVLVAVTAVSGPDCGQIYTRETRVSVDPRTLVSPRIVAARSLACSTAASVSVVSPDWLTARTVLSILMDFPCCSTNSDAAIGWMG